MAKEVAWWKHAVIYQIYPLSFKDSNGDGIGDIQGIREKLDYLKNLGVDVIWLSPIYLSPMDDNGYDISNYQEINPMFGTKEDLKHLLDEVHEKGMKLIMDLVINHTSDEHPWFIQAKSSKDNPYRDYYIWKDEPNLITSVFGGPAWTKDQTTNQYYFHLFSSRQPDLNWRNPKLRSDIYQMINDWLDFGIDGFRLDVIDLIGKDIDHYQLSDGPYFETYLQELHQNCFQNRKIMTVGETPGLSINRAAEISHQGLLDMVFQFTHIGLDEVPNQGKWALKALDLVEFKHVFMTLQKTMFNHGWNSLFLANHDQPRAVSRYGNLKYRKESATMLATILYGMQGTPFVYQGEEIGMTGVQYDIQQYQDIETKKIYQILKQKGISEDEIMRSIHAKSRDNSRTPFQWNHQPHAGFSSAKPWLDVNPNYIEVNAENDLLDDFSVYSFFKKLFEIRKAYQVFTDGDFDLIQPNHPKLFIYQRKNVNDTMLVIGSFSSEPQEVNLFISEEPKSLLISNYPDHAIKDLMILPPYYAAIIRIGEINHANH